MRVKIKVSLLAVTVDGGSRLVPMVVAARAQVQFTSKDDRMLEAEVLEEISTLVRSGFYDKDRLLPIFLEEMYEPGELDEASVAAAIDVATEEWDRENSPLVQQTRPPKRRKDCGSATLSVRSSNVLA